MSRWIRRDVTAIGLDIGSGSVKMVKVSRGAQGWVLLQHSETILPHTIPLEERSRIVRQALDALGPDRARIVTAVGGAGTVLRSVSVPKMTPEELKAALHFEAEKFIPFKPEEVFLDSVIVEGLPGGRMEIILAAARKDLVHSQLELLASAKIVPKALTLDAAALANAWEMSGPETAATPSVLMHLGARGTVLNFMGGKAFRLRPEEASPGASALRFSREIGLGGESFTRAVADGLNVSPAEAERIKCQPAERAAEVRAALQPCWEEWLAQCRASFDFYENQFGQPVAGIFLSGGTARLAGLQAWVQESTSLPTALWNPLRVLVQAGRQAPSDEAALSFGVAVGLAVTGAAG